MKNEFIYSHCHKVLITGDSSCDTKTIVGLLTEYLSDSASKKINYAINLERKPNSTNPKFSLQPVNSVRLVSFSLHISEAENFEDGRLTNLSGLIDEINPHILYYFINVKEALTRFNGLWGDLENHIEACLDQNIRPFFFLYQFENEISDCSRKWMNEKGCSLNDYLFLLSFQLKKLPQKLKAEETESALVISRAIRDYSTIYHLHLTRPRKFDQAFFSFQHRDKLSAALSLQIIKMVLSRDKLADYKFENTSTLF